MNLHNLLLFKQVVEVGNMTEAAKLLHMTQPAISMHIKRMEKKFSVPLITSYPKGIKPTDAGKVLLQFCEKFKDIEEQMWRSMEEYREGNKGHIIIGAPIELRTYLLPPIIAHFFMSFPGIQIEERTVRDHEIETYVKRGIIDIGLSLNKEINHLESRITMFTSNPLLLFTGHTTDMDSNLYITDKAIMTDEPELIKRYQNIHLVDSPELAKQAVIAGLGDGIALRCTIEAELKFNLIKIIQEIRVDTVSILTRPAERIQNSVRVFINHVLSNK
ncbi:hypothetical protein CVD28_25050 [Bacillus sp. M6-12]|uniref:LysR family transcriptional regulator n=1 Tax=Bacillus sp. M6-12 TaxID=2054166 RepID=UPI000C75E9A6|nr:LysR family transcriptional regulator [Bacillus sp. M6-12]PLS14991.1 hypothetical protein CVD28_25050 [Bacillus sp. M6-12]